jgi:hypothetical protein
VAPTVAGSIPVSHPRLLIKPQSSFRSVAPGYCLSALVPSVRCPRIVNCLYSDYFRHRSVTVNQNGRAFIVHQIYVRQTDALHCPTLQHFGFGAAAGASRRAYRILILEAAVSGCDATSGCCADDGTDGTLLGLSDLRQSSNIEHGCRTDSWTSSRKTEIKARSVPLIPNTRIVQRSFTVGVPDGN